LGKVGGDRMLVVYLGALFGVISGVLELIFMVLGILCFIKYLKSK
jgi:hypothetical protein